MLLKLVRHDWRVMWREFRHSKGWWWQLPLSVGVGGGILAFVFWMGRNVFSFLSEMVPAFVPVVLTLMLAAIALSGFLIGIAAMLYDLYLKTDMELLLAAPLPLGSLFGQKLSGGYVGVALVALIGLAFLVGAGQALGATVVYYVYLVLLLLFLSVLTSALAMIAVMFIVRVVAPKWIQGALAVVGAAAGASAWLAYVLWWDDELVAGAAESPAAWAEMSEWLVETPLAWPGGLLQSVQEGASGEPWLALGILAAATLGVVGGAFGVFVRSFYIGQGRVREVTTQARRTSADRPRARRRLPFLPPAVGAIVLKDWRFLRRDLKHASKLIFPLVVGGFLIFSVSGRLVDVGAGEVGDTQLLYWLRLAMMMFIPFLLANEIALPAVGSEGKRVDLLRVSPVSPGTLLGAKFLGAFLPIAALLIAVQAGFWVFEGVTLGLAVASIGAIVWITGGIITIHVTTGTLFARFRGEQTSKNAGFAATMVAWCTSALFVYAHAGLIAVLLGLELPVVVDTLASAVGIAVLAVGGIATLAVLAVRRLAALEV